MRKRKHVATHKRARSHCAVSRPRRIALTSKGREQAIPLLRTRRRRPMATSLRDPLRKSRPMRRLLLRKTRRRPEHHHLHQRSARQTRRRMLKPTCHRSCRHYTMFPRSCRLCATSLICDRLLAMYHPSCRLYMMHLRLRRLGKCRLASRQTSLTTSLRRSEWLMAITSPFTKLKRRREMDGLR